MKSKVEYAVLVLVIGLLGLAILASTVFGKPEPKLYTVTISGVINCVEFETPGNKPRTRFNPFPKEELPVEVELTFVSILPPDSKIYEETGHCFRWSPLEDNLASLCDDEDHYQILDDNLLCKWEFHHININGNSLYCRFDLKFYKYEGAWDHYVLDINMEFEKEVDTYTSVGKAAIDWTHYTETTKKTKGKKLEIEFQHLEYPSEGELTITITE